MAEKIFKSLSEFMNWAGEFDKGEYLFRGVKKASYIENKEVKTSSERRLSDEDRSITSEEILEINKELLEKVRSIGHDQKDGKKLSDLNLLAELQHFGAATCLIDFTSSALIALWFACQQEQQEPGQKQENGKVVVLRSDGPKPLKKVDYDTSEEENIDYFFKTDNMGRYPRYQWQPQNQNNRIIAQQSVFVFGRTTIKIDDECEIAASKKVEILEALEDLSGITGERLFADFYGYAWLNAGDKPDTEPTVRANRRKGVKAHQKGDTEKAIEYFDKAIKINKGRNLDSENAENYRERGRAHYAAENYTKAIDDYDMAIKLTPENLKLDRAVAYNLLGIARVAKGDAIMKKSGKQVIEEDAAKNGKQVIEEDAAADIDALFNEAISDYNEVINYYDAMIEKDDELTKVYNNLGNVYASKGILARWRGDSDKKVDEFFNEAISYYKIVIGMENEFTAMAHDNRGETYLHKFDWENARKDLKIAEEKGVDIVCTFRNDYKSTEEFEKINKEALPEDIAEMLKEKETE